MPPHIRGLDIEDCIISICTCQAPILLQTCQLWSVLSALAGRGDSKAGTGSPRWFVAFQHQKEAWYPLCRSKWMVWTNETRNFPIARHLHMVDVVDVSLPCQILGRVIPTSKYLPSHPSHWSPVLFEGSGQLLGVALHAAFAVDRGKYQGTPLLAVLGRWEACEAGAPRH